MKNILRKPPGVKPLKRTLADFDLTDEALAKITRDAHAERMRLSPNAPKNAAGTTFYIWFVSLLRDYLVGIGNGWVTRTVNGLEVVEHAERRVRIAYVVAESQDGELVSSHRGPVSLAAAAKNGQTVLFTAEQLAPQPRVRELRAQEPVFQTWFVAVNRAEGLYLLELALPTEQEGSRFTSWAEQLPIAEVRLDTEPKLDETEAAASATAVPKPKRKRSSSEVGAAKTGTDDEKSTNDMRD